MTLEELYYDEYISTRTYNVCKKHGLNNVTDIQNFYKQKGNFSLLHNLGKKSNEELLLICNSSQFVAKNIDSGNINDNDVLLNENNEIINIDILLTTDRITTRTYNVCLYNDLLNNLDIVNYCRINGNFTKLRNCGKFSNEQLIGIYYEEKEKFPIIEEEKINILNSLVNLNDFQKKIIESIFSNKFKKLSTRTRNSVIKALNSKLNVYCFLEKFPTKDSFALLEQIKISLKSINELIEFKIFIEKEILKYAVIEDIEILRKHLNYFFITEYFGEDSSFLTPEETSSVFYILDKLIQHNKIFKDNESFIFKYCNRIYKNEKYLLLNEAAVKLNFTKERVRQIRVSIMDRLPDLLQFIKHLSDPVLDKILIDKNKDYIDTSEVTITEMIDNNNLKFTEEFILFICSIFSNSNYRIVGSYKDTLMYRDFKFRDKYNWKKIYLLKRELYDVFRVKTFINAFEIILHDNYENDTEINLRDFLRKFVSINSDYFFVRLLMFAELLLEKEFAVQLNTNKQITLHRTSHKKYSDYMYDALLAIGHPAASEEIFRYCAEHFPGVIVSESTVPRACLRNDKITSVGRSSIYALKIWEVETDNFKGGTILKIVEEFLQEFNEPQHISVIEKHVKKYRPETNSKNIWNNLRVDPKKTFTFFKNSFIGLCYRIYDGKFQILDPEVDNKSLPWEERFQQLKTFVSQNNHLPLSGSVNIFEVSLYRWMKTQTTLYRAGKIKEEKVKPLLEFLSTFPNRNYRKFSRHTTIEKYSKLSDFITRVGRLPKSTISSENSLYRFWKNQNNAFKEGKLSSEELKFYNNILSFFENGSQLHFVF